MKIISVVITDLVTDQRVHRSCLLMHNMGYDVKLIGRILPSSLPMPKREYKCKRVRLPFTKGPAFYASFNIYLFFKLLFSSFDAVWANDLDTLLACRLVSKLRRKKLIFDSHEYFTEAPELLDRPRVKKFWKRIERRIVPKLPFMITVNDSIANLFTQEYNIPVVVVRNVPLKIKDVNYKTRTELNLPEDKKILIIQGSGINIDRGVEEAVLAMKNIENAILLIIGGGDVFPKLKEIVKNEKLENKVYLIPKLKREELIHYTAAADIGLTLDKNTSINYLYSLPNKIFDYIQAGIAVLGTNLPEIANIIKKYNVGITIEKNEVHLLTETLNKMLSDEKNILIWKKNSILASEELCWENESKALSTKIKEYVG